MKKHVLVVDYEPLIRNRICTLLERREFSCDQAATVDEAESLLERSDYHVLMLDLMIPGQNGFLALQQLRTRFPEQSEHIVVMTNADRKFIENLPADGWCAVLLKPFATSELYRVVELCVGGDDAGVACH